MESSIKVRDVSAVGTVNVDVGQLTGRIDELCLSLFDHWCEHRRILPLASLMQNWPLLTLDHHRIRKLSRALIDLINFDRHTWTENERTIIFELLEVTINAAGDLPWM